MTVYLRPYYVCVWPLVSFLFHSGNFKGFHKKPCIPRDISAKYISSAASIMLFTVVRIPRARRNGVQNIAEVLPHFRNAKIYIALSDVYLNTTQLHQLCLAFSVARHLQELSCDTTSL